MNSVPRNGTDAIATMTTASPATAMRSSAMVHRVGEVPGGSARAGGRTSAPRGARRALTAGTTSTTGTAVSDSSSDAEDRRADRDRHRPEHLSLEALRA